jgi:predicted Holliday junction resolvase-like endonuclease
MIAWIIALILFICLIAVLAEFRLRSKEINLLKTRYEKGIKEADEWKKHYKNALQKANEWKKRYEEIEKRTKNEKLEEREKKVEESEKFFQRYRIDEIRALRER